MTRVARESLVLESAALATLVSAISVESYFFRRETSYMRLVREKANYQVLTVSALAKALGSEPQARAEVAPQHARTERARSAVQRVPKFAVAQQPN